MGGDDGGAARAVELRERIHDETPGRVVQVSQRFVHEEDVGPPGQRAREAGAQEFPGAQFLGGGAEFRSEANAGEECGGRGPPCGDAAGAVEALTRSVKEFDDITREAARASAWYRFHLGRALEALGRRDEALKWLAAAAPLNDVVLDWIDRDPALAALRADPRTAEALRTARESFDP